MLFFFIPVEYETIEKASKTPKSQLKDRLEISNQEEMDKLFEELIGLGKVFSILLENKKLPFRFKI